MLEREAGASALEVIEFFLHIWHAVLSRSNFQAGCAVLAVTVATDSPGLLNQSASAFRAWRKWLAELLEQGGLKTRLAAGLAATLIASCEGAVFLSGRNKAWNRLSWFPVNFSNTVGN